MKKLLLCYVFIFSTLMNSKGFAESSHQRDNQAAIAEREKECAEKPVELKETSLEHELAIYFPIAFTYAIYWLRCKP